MNASVTTTAPRELEASRLPLAGVLGAAVAAAGNLAVYGVAKIAGVSLVAQFDPQAPAASLAPAMVVIASVVPAVAATALLALLNRFVSKPSRVFAGVATVFALVSMGGPASLAGADTGTKATLAVMHLVAGAAITLVLLRRSAATR